ncbi:hypothetical protein QCA50_003727 [Cerrena zonata]|uniref:Uncharacterized protein n=1 Tax=Cerrena zonata TaxID=2478898 RepID=A0AAW0GF60_9APHY
MELLKQYRECLDIIYDASKAMETIERLARDPTSSQSPHTPERPRIGASSPITSGSLRTPKRPRSTDGVISSINTPSLRTSILEHVTPTSTLSSTPSSQYRDQTPASSRLMSRILLTPGSPATQSASKSQSPPKKRRRIASKGDIIDLTGDAIDVPYGTNVIDLTLSSDSD